MFINQDQSLNIYILFCSMPNLIISGNISQEAFTYTVPSWNGWILGRQREETDIRFVIDILPKEKPSGTDVFQFVLFLSALHPTPLPMTASHGKQQQPQVHPQMLCCKTQSGDRHKEQRTKTLPRTTRPAPFALLF